MTMRLRRISLRSFDFRKIREKIAGEFESKVRRIYQEPDGFSLRVTSDFTNEDLDRVKEIVTNSDAIVDVDAKGLRKRKHGEVESEVAKIKDLNDVKRELKAIEHLLIWHTRKRLFESDEE